MPAYFESGFTVRKPSWHRQETVLDDYPTDWNDARTKAGLLWEPTLRPVYEMVGDPTCTECAAHIGDPHSVTCMKGTLLDGEMSLVTPEDAAARFAEIPGKRRVARDDTMSTLGIVSQDWSPVFHRTMGEVVEAILGEGAKFETTIVVNGGRQVAALCYLDEPVVVAGDDSHTLPFLAVLNDHTGQGAFKVLYTDIRVVCWNTYRMAEMTGERHGRQFVFRHTGDVMGRIEDAKLALAGLREETQEWIDFANDLYQLKLTDEAQAVADFMHDFPGLASPREHGLPTSDRVEENVARARKVFKALYFDSVTTQGHRGTALGLVDSAVEYLDHVRGYRSQDTYLGRTLLKSEPLKARAVKLARRVAG